MENQNPKNLLPVLLAVIITAVVVGGGMYLWQTSQESLPTTENEVVEETSTRPETESIISETQKSDFALSIDQAALGESVVTIRDTYNEGLDSPCSFLLLGDL